VVGGRECPSRDSRRLALVTSSWGPVPVSSLRRADSSFYAGARMDGIHPRGQEMGMERRSGQG